MTKPAQKSCLTHIFRPKTRCRLLGLVLTQGRGPPPTATASRSRTPRAAEAWRVPSLVPPRSQQIWLAPMDGRNVALLLLCTRPLYIHGAPSSKEKNLTLSPLSPLSHSHSHSLSPSQKILRHPRSHLAHTIPPCFFFLIPSSSSSLPFFPSSWNDGTQHHRQHQQRDRTVCH